MRGLEIFDRVICWEKLTSSQLDKQLQIFLKFKQLIWRNDLNMHTNTCFFKDHRTIVQWMWNQPSINAICIQYNETNQHKEGYESNNQSLIRDMYEMTFTVHIIVYLRKLSVVLRIDFVLYVNNSAQENSKFLLLCRSQQLECCLSTT